LNLPAREGASNVGEEPHSHFNYEWDNLRYRPPRETWSGYTQLPPGFRMTDRLPETVMISSDVL